MNKLSDKQRDKIRNFLLGQGMTFEPLLEEMLDHIASDVEERIAIGIDFEKAWNEIRNDIPQNHLQTIQNETMETIEKRFTISRILSFLALASLLVATVFKLLHLSGAIIPLLFSFIAMAGAFLSSTISGIHFHKEKKGSIRVLSIVVGTLLLLLGYSFRLLQLNGADSIIVSGAGVSFLSLFFNTVYIYANHAGESDLLTHLHEKYTPGIERFFMFLLVPVGILKIITLTAPQQPFPAAIILVIIIYGASLQFFALIWRNLAKHPENRTLVISCATILSFTCLTILITGLVMPVAFRLALITTFAGVTAWLSYNIDAPKNKFVIFVVCLVPLLFFINFLIRLNLISITNSALVFNIVVLCILATAIFISEKHTAVRTFLILSLGAYLLEYNGNLF